MSISVRLIYARASNGVIGKDNAMPWHLPEDLAHFKQLTQGHPVIMGRKTWDSLPARFRPLPGRTNIVVTRQSDWQAEGAAVEGAPVVRVASLQEALDAAAQCSTTGEVWVMGGAQIYAQALPLADRVEVTVIHQDFEGDAFAPELDPQDWHIAAQADHVSAKGLAYSFITYTRAATA